MNEATIQWVSKHGSWNTLWVCEEAEDPEECLIVCLCFIQTLWHPILHIKDIQMNVLTLPSPSCTFSWSSIQALLWNLWREDAGCSRNANCFTLNGGKKVRTQQKVLIYGSRNTFDIHFRSCGQLKKQPAKRLTLTMVQCGPPVCLCVCVRHSVRLTACVRHSYFRNVLGALLVKFAADVSDSPNTHNK